jgi:endonuclease/exonuclease/phosphatase family metal-dependent hydrolase
MKLRFVTWNIHKGIGGVDRRYEPERTAAALRSLEPDVCLLQEVDRGVKRSRFHSQAELLAELLGFPHLAFVANVKVLGGGEYGNAILARHPLHAVENLDLTIPPKKRRSALHAKLRIHLDGGHERTIHLYSMHLGLSGIERGIQLTRFLATESLSHIHRETPTIVGGDLNDVYGTLGRKFLLPAGFRGPAKIPPTFPAFQPLRALDGLYVRGTAELTTLLRPRTKLLEQASDHLPLVADVVVS